MLVITFGFERARHSSASTIVSRPLTYGYNASLRVRNPTRFYFESSRMPSMVVLLSIGRVLLARCDLTRKLPC